MNNSSIEKQQKSIIWTVATIWANIIIVGLIWAVVSQLLNRLFPQFFALSPAQILIWLINIAVVIFSIWLGIKSVLKKSIIPQSNFLGISLWVTAVAIFLQAALTILAAYNTSELSDLSKIIIRYIIFDIGLFAVTYFWLKRLAEDNDEPSETQQFQSTDQSNQPQQPSQMQMPQSPFQRWLPTIVGIAIVVFVGGGVFAYQTWWGGPSAPKEDRVSDWETYVNKNDGYSIMHPSEFWPQQDHNLMNYDIDDPRYERGNPDGVKIQIQKHALGSNFESFDEYIAYQKNIPGDSFSDSAKSVKLGDFITLSQYTKTGPGGAFMTYTAFDKNSNNYFNILIFESGYSKNKELVEQILSTFKFID